MKSIWEEYKNIKFPSLKENLKTEVLVIGGGISGILCAHYLKESGKEVVLVEMDRIANKKTRKTTAVITALQDMMYHDYPIDTAKLFLKANLNALEEYKKLANKYDFDFEECSSFKYAQQNEKDLEKEYECLKKMGANVKYTDSLGVPINFKRAIEMINQGQMNPIKLVNNLAKKIKIFENTKIVKLKKNTAYTENYEIEFDSVVVATGYPFLKLKGLYPLKLHQVKSHVISVSNKDNFLGNGIGVNPLNIYFRSYKDELLIGSCDIKTGSNCHGFEEINDFIFKHYDIKNIKYKWINEDTVSLDGLPYIGSYGNKNWYVTTGYNLWGMTASMISAQIITDMINEEENEFIEIFNPSRKVLVKQLFENVKTAAKNLLTFKGPRCSHLGCRLHYNCDDDTYECKCHGSKYDKTGKLIETPAQKDINI